MSILSAGIPLCMQCTTSFCAALLEQCTDLFTPGSRQRLQKFFVSFPRLLINADYLTSGTRTHNLKFQLKKGHCYIKRVHRGTVQAYDQNNTVKTHLPLPYFSFVFLGFNYVRGQSFSPHVGTFSKSPLPKVSLNL